MHGNRILMLHDFFSWNESTFLPFKSLAVSVRDRRGLSNRLGKLLTRYQIVQKAHILPCIESSTDGSKMRSVMYNP